MFNRMKYKLSIRHHGPSILNDCQDVTSDLSDIVLHSRTTRRVEGPSRFFGPIPKLFGQA
jgi:hypothetical protein